MSPRINQLLTELPDEEYQRIYPYLETAVLSKGHDLWPSGKAPSHVYFPVGAVVSLMIDLSDGFSVEAFMLGKQSLFGSSMDPQPSFYRARVRTGGACLPIAHWTLPSAHEAMPNLGPSNGHADGAKHDPADLPCDGLRQAPFGGSAAGSLAVDHVGHFAGLPHRNDASGNFGVARLQARSHHLGLAQVDGRWPCFCPSWRDRSAGARCSGSDGL
jgi:hypothetical protein